MDRQGESTEGKSLGRWLAGGEPITDLITSDSIRTPSNEEQRLVVVRRQPVHLGTRSSAVSRKSLVGKKKKISEKKITQRGSTHISLNKRLQWCAGVDKGIVCPNNNLIGIQPIQSTVRSVNKAVGRFKAEILDYTRIRPYKIKRSHLLRTGNIGRSDWSRFGIRKCSNIENVPHGRYPIVRVKVIASRSTLIRKSYFP